MDGNNAIYEAIMDSVKLNGVINALEAEAVGKLNYALSYASSLSETDNREEKLKQMNEALALNKFLKAISYIKGNGVPMTVTNDIEKHLNYILSVFR